MLAILIIVDVVQGKYQKKLLSERTEGYMPSVDSVSRIIMRLVRELVDDPSVRASLGNLNTILLTLIKINTKVKSGPEVKIITIVSYVQSSVSSQTSGYYRKIWSM